MFWVTNVHTSGSKSSQNIYQNTTTGANSCFEEEKQGTNGTGEVTKDTHEEKMKEGKEEREKRILPLNLNNRPAVVHLLVNSCHEV